MDIELIATGLGHRKASYELFNQRHEAQLTEGEWLILCKIQEILIQESRGNLNKSEKNHLTIEDRIVI